MIKPDTIGKIFDAARIEEVVGDFVTLKRRGVNMMGLCPFHNEKTPSFTVSPAKGIFKCFGCGKGGNAVNFVMEHEHFTYPEALKYLARKYNIEIEEEKPTEEELQQQDEKEALFNLTAFAQKHFEYTLHETEEGRAVGLTYFTERGFTRDTIRKFGLGYSLNNWNDFTTKAIKNGYKKDILEKSSLAKTRDGQTYDTFRARITFPIHNLSGRVLGFGARILTNDKKKPKYINTAESEIYHKGKVLYGLYFAKSSIIKFDNCYLTEGYTDVISLYQAGVENVIASSGTALTIDQIKLIKRYTHNITLLFDGDAAGIKAAFRGIDMILGEEMNVRVVLFPDGEDPDSYARNYRPAEVKEFIEGNAYDFITFKTNLLLAETENDPIRKAALIKEIALSIAHVPDAIARSLYVKKSSSLLDVEENLMMAEVNKQRRTKSKNEQNQPTRQEEQTWEGTESAGPAVDQAKPVHSSYHQEAELIRALLLYHNQMINFKWKDEQGIDHEADIAVADYLISEIASDEIVLEDPLFQSIFEVFIKARNKGEFPEEKYFFNHPDPNISTTVIDMLTSPYELSPNWEEKHSIFVSREDENIKKYVEKTLYSFKLDKLKKVIQEKDELLKNQPADDYDPETIKLIIHLKNIRRLYSDKLDRIVLQ